MKIFISSVFVDDQSKAIKFYTETLGFVTKNDIPLGEYRWLTVVAADGKSDMELLLEPNENPAAKTFQQAIYEQGIPATTFEVEQITKTVDSLTEKGVIFRVGPTKAGDVTIAVLDDTCGNLIQLVQIN